MKATENYLVNKVRLPVVREEFFYPTEASVELESEHPGEKNVIGTCMRAAFYRYSGEFKGQAYTPYSHWIFLTGKALEEALVENWKQMGIWVDNNIKFRSKEHHVSGELDIVIKDPEDGKLKIVEIKTYYGYEATKEICGNPKKGIPGKPKDNNLLQILVYLYLHQHIFESGKLIYIDKVSQNNAEFDISLTKEGDSTYPVINGVVQRRFAVEEIFERYELLGDYIEQKQLPPRDYEIQYSPERVERLWKEKKISKTKYEAWQDGKPVGDWACSYCRYKAECWSIALSAQDEGDE